MPSMILVDRPADGDRVVEAELRRRPRSNPGQQKRGAGRDREILAIRMIIPRFRNQLPDGGGGAWTCS